MLFFCVAVPKPILYLLWPCNGCGQNDLDEDGDVWEKSDQFCRQRARQEQLTQTQVEPLDQSEMNRFIDIVSCILTFKDKEKYNHGGLSDRNFASCISHKNYIHITLCV